MWIQDVGHGEAEKVERFAEKRWFGGFGEDDGEGVSVDAVVFRPPCGRFLGRFGPAGWLDQRHGHWHNWRR